MITIMFPDREAEKRALAFLIGRFSGRVLRSGEHLVPEAALEALADQDVPFVVTEKANDGQRRRAVGVAVREVPPPSPAGRKPGDGFLRTEGALADDTGWDGIMGGIYRARKQERRPPAADLGEP